ncbi:MAG: NosD domain-containing protein [Candidatus Bathyarchaeia archaeon]
MAVSRSNMIIHASPSILEVGPSESYKNIQEAINNASPGDIIHVSSGIYYENIVINKSVTLIGKDRENTIIDGRSLGNVISIQASNVNISGFTIQNSSTAGCGIYIERLASGVIISNNYIKVNDIGIQIDSSSRNQICENVISANNIGILLFYSSSNVICRNIIKDNSDGIDVYYYSINNLICENTLSGNYWGTYILLNSNGNVFYRNNFIGNNHNAYVEQVNNIWDFNGEGNYWDDYNGKDLNKDGIGDFPYNITKGNTDHYPLMGQYRTFIAYCNGNAYHVVIISNSTIFDFTFKTLVETKSKIILFNASISSNSASFSRVAIPKVLMKCIHAVLVNDEEVNATFLNVDDVENTYLYIEHFGNCSIKIVYSELLDWYYQLLSDYSKLLDKYYGLNESYSMLLELNAKILEFNVSVSMFIEKLSILNTTLYNLLEDYGGLQGAFNYINLLYQNQTQNLRSLIYIFAATTTIFILTTIYFSKKANEKVAEPKHHAE